MFFTMLNLALSLLLLASTAAAATLPMTTRKLRDQQILLDSALEPYRPTESSRGEARYLDADPNTVGVIFMNTKDEGAHVWLPLGVRVFVRESRVLPVRPLTARITSLVGNKSQRASKEALDRIGCRVYPKSSGDFPTEDDFAVHFSTADDLVRLAAKGGIVDGLDGWEVESYECE
ncbi:uncharacterized protein LTR77_002834 [Saxophila tyrrhenica]|uniref:Uncharacterized protein n=1 Tax=Saxophila tyrrhenica TaxID=1690608 RepID=A0AAV9PIH8_9PEZI|nr:hypothetical protein LTR77_002834 [Saxophila tyrrhenica]